MHDHLPESPFPNGLLCTSETCRCCRDSQNLRRGKSYTGRVESQPEHLWGSGITQSGCGIHYSLELKVKNNSRRGTSGLWDSRSEICVWRTPEAECPDYIIAEDILYLGKSHKDCVCMCTGLCVCLTDTSDLLLLIICALKVVISLPDFPTITMILLFGGNHESYFVHLNMKF